MTGPDDLVTSNINSQAIYNEWKNDTEFDQKIVDIDEIEENFSDTLDQELINALRSAGL